MEMRTDPKGALLQRVVFLLIISLMLYTYSYAQVKCTISGIVKDAQTGESLIGATAVTAQLKGDGVVTNDYGFYSLIAD